MITILDYGLGNILAFSTTYRRLGIPVRVAKNSADLTDVQKLILPGVGAFDLAMTLFQQSGMREVVDQLVLEQHVPVIGICVGMQMMAGSSEEGNLQGLGWIPGRVRRFSQPDIQLPHMGWNDVTPRQASPLFNELEQGARFYFLHSYYYESDHSAHVLANSEYGSEFACAVQNGNAYGVQFHPEKSHHYGEQLLKNFAEL